MRVLGRLPGSRRDPLKVRGRGQALPLLHLASSDPSPQWSFPSHRWLSGMHFPLPHLKVLSGQPGKHTALSGVQVQAEWTAGSRAPTGSPPRAAPRGHSLQPSSSLLSPQSLTVSHTQKRGLQNLFLHVNW